MYRKFVLVVVSFAVTSVCGELVKEFNYTDDLALGYGYIYNLTTQDVSSGEAIFFDSHGILNAVNHVSGGSDIIINQAGVYVINFLTQGIFANCFVLYLNGKPVLGSSYEPIKNMIDRNDKEYGQVLLRLLEGDVITLRNYSPARGQTVAHLKAAGKMGKPLSVNASIVMYQIG